MTSLQLSDDLVDRLWAAVIVTDPAGIITGWNRHAEELYGYSRAEAVGRPLFELIVAEPEAAAEELATRAAQAIDNALLYRERSEVARTLQASLLPPRLPDIPGLELGARYLAAGTGSEAGGDFYDAFLTGPGRWLLVIGDVRGKGEHAAAITGMARHTIRSIALMDDEPSAVLRHLNEVLLLADDGADWRFCTVSVVRVEPHSGGGRVTACAAGHPLPLLLRRDRATRWCA